MTKSMRDKAASGFTTIYHGISSVAGSSPVVFVRDAIAYTLRELPKPPFINVTDPIASFIEYDIDIESYNPEAMAKLIEPYERSYDLTEFEKYAEEAIEKTTSLPSITSTSEGGDRTIDLLSFGELGQRITSNRNEFGDEEENLVQLQAQISANLPLEKVRSGEGSIAMKLAKLKQDIHDNSDEYHNPQQIIQALRNLKKETKEELVREQKETCDRIRALFALDNEDRTEATERLATLCGIRLYDPLLVDKLRPEVDNLVDHVKKTYEDSIAEVDRFYDGTDTLQEDDKEATETEGMLKKLQHEKARVEADLFNRVMLLKKLEKHGFKIHSVENLTATIGDAEEDEKKKSACLKGRSLDSLLNEEVDGVLWGKRRLSHTTRYGNTILKEQSQDGQYTQIRVAVNPQYFKNEEQWAKGLRADYEDMIDLIKTKKTNKDSIEFHHKHKNDKNRLRMIEESYRAARLKGFEPDQIKMNVSGSEDEKLNFSSESAQHILASVGLGHLEEQIQAEKSQTTSSAKKNMSKLRHMINPEEPNPTPPRSGPRR